MARSPKPPRNRALAWQDLATPAAGGTLRRDTHADAQLLLQVTRAIGVAHDETEMFSTTLAAMCRSFGWIYGETWCPARCPDGTVELVQGPVYGSSEAHVRVFSRTGGRAACTVTHGITGWAWTMRCPIWLPDVTETHDSVRIDVAREAGARTAAAIPLVVDDDVVAIFLFFALEPRFTNAKHLTFLGAVATQVGIALQQKRAEQALRDRERRLRTIFDATHEFVGLLAPDGTVLAANDAALAFIGRREEDVAGQLFWDTPWWSENPALQDRLRQAVSAAAAGEPAHFEAEQRGADGRLMTVDFFLTPVRDDTGRVIFLVPEGYDITDRDKIARLKGELIGHVSHELRTPIGAIRGALDALMLQEGPLPERAQRFADMAVRNADRLLQLVNNVLDLERIESGAGQLERRVCQAGMLINQAVEAIMPVALQAGIELIAEPSTSEISGDGSRLIQVLTNLIANAIKFSPSGSVVAVSAADAEEGMVRFAVRDAGRGIPEEARERIFGRFEQAMPGDAREQRGSGLGLAIAKAIVEQHGGRIWVESTVGVGSTFSFTIPCSDT